MKKLMGLVGATAGGWLGWVVGAPLGLAAGFLVSMIASGVGMYVAVRWASRYY
jgi:hypothetical protein